MQDSRYLLCASHSLSRQWLSYLDHLNRMGEICAVEVCQCMLDDSSIVERMQPHEQPSHWSLQSTDVTIRAPERLSQGSAVHMLCVTHISIEGVIWVGMQEVYIRALILIGCAAILMHRRTSTEHMLPRMQILIDISMILVHMSILTIVCQSMPVVSSNAEHSLLLALTPKMKIIPSQTFNWWDLVGPWRTRRRLSASSCWRCSSAQLIVLTHHTKKLQVSTFTTRCKQCIHIIEERKWKMRMLS